MVLVQQCHKHFFLYLALDVTASFICEIHCLALDGFNLNTVHKLSNKEKKISAELGFDPRGAGWEAKVLPLCYAVPQQWQNHPKGFSELPLSIQVLSCFQTPM